jgi:16S rRNA (cytosine967-C5)-methyltransferase
VALAAAPVGGGSGRERWLDLCAGPGGKAGLLAALALERDADIVANELSPHRADLVRRTLAAAMGRGRPEQVTVRTGDGRDVGASEPDAFDRVLVDAPCTGLGALRRRPEARWRRQPGDVPGLATLQRELLTSALDATRPGGVVAYATCSPHLGETRFVVSDVVKRRADVEVVDASGVVVDREGRAVEGTGEAPYVQLWPHRHDTDGMFLALLRRR